MVALGLHCCMRAFSSCRGRGYSSLRCTGFLLRWLLLLQSSESTYTGFSCCNTQAQQLWLGGLVIPRHVESSRTKIEFMSPALAGGLLSPVPQGKAKQSIFVSWLHTQQPYEFSVNSDCWSLWILLWEWW